MSMLSSMYAGVSGLNVHGKGLSSVADNIANVSTHGYKATRCNFGDVLVQSLTVGGSVVNQVGSGARVLNVQQLLTQGSFEATDIPTDMAINGSGFFKVRRPVTTTTFGANVALDNMNTGPAYYTRAGQFIMDKEGYLVNPTGLRLQGYNINSQGNLSLIPEDLRILTQQTDAISTTKIDLSLNLDAEDLTYHVPSETIVPTDQSTYNYMTTVRTYDALGVAHDLAMIYQRLEPDSYTGPSVPGSERVWKVGIFEKVGDEFVQTNLTDGFSGYFYLHFDDYGHLVGNTTGQPAMGDSWATRTTLGTGGSPISHRAGETFSFNTDPDNDPASNVTFRSKLTLDMAAWDQDGDSVTINGSTYRWADYSSVEDLAAEINRTAGNNGVFCKYTAPDQIELFTSGNTTASVTFTNAGTGNLTSTGVTADQFRNAINGVNSADVVDLRTARGAVYLGETFPITTGSVTIGGIGITLDGMTQAQARQAIQDALDLNGMDVTATLIGNSIYLEANNEGSAYNYAISTTGSVTSTPTMVGGMDAPTPNVQMEQDADGTFILRRIDQGLGAILNVSGGNTMANGAFNMRQTAYAMDQEEPFSTNADESGPQRKGIREISFDWLDATGAHESQPITLDFIPAVSAPTTQSAGNSEIFYLYQDGCPRGNLEGLDIGRDGLITGNFSNGTVKLLGSVLLYNFASPENLKREGENLWSATLAAGPEVGGRPGEASLGYVESGALEQSNVDLANEFVKMINYQRAFQANSKTISTTDEMLAELINLKR